MRFNEKKSIRKFKKREILNPSISLNLILNFMPMAEKSGSAFSRDRKLRIAENWLFLDGMALLINIFVFFSDADQNDIGHQYVSHLLGYEIITFLFHSLLSSILECSAQLSNE